ncbi:RNA-binding protein Musashi homolog 2-like [Solanum pennellii]|uniref:RNA-binding protein Musashi homolog 2-like n=1 Tax=Solanum pennellii TaxID=28526 RepID=A0ABM1VC83_SOLPN|nr:RNA-binding protein Musashi homolog 2-like [Solanum pennellii]
MADREAPGSSARSLFIGGISMDITEESLRAHFSQFGEIADLVLKRDKGFGFVTYANPETVDEVLNTYHNIASKEVDVKIPVTYRQRIHVGDLPLSLTEVSGELKEYFSSYGNVVGNQIILDKTTGRSRGFAFVSFDKEEAVEKVLSHGDRHELCGKQVKTTRVFPVRAGDRDRSCGCNRENAGIESDKFASKAANEF